MITLRPNYLKKESTMKRIIIAVLVVIGFTALSATAQKPWVMRLRKRDGLTTTGT